MTQVPQQPATVQSPSDGSLLRRFVQDADEEAFTQIVERHASMVMAVCRRVVGQTADVDDAFQATFYALSQRPHSIRECRSLSGWLYSVAWRTSIRLVRLRKQRKMEPLPDQVPGSQSDPLDQIAKASNLSTLDEELNQLPEKYRHVLVMSYFAHQTNQEIADQLNESKGAVDGRIRDARSLLRVRLAKRGVEIGALAIAGAMTQSAAAAVSPELISSTVQFAKLSSGFSSAGNVTGVDMNQMQLLSSTGTTVMGINVGTIFAAGLLMVSGALGLSQLSEPQKLERVVSPATTSIASVEAKSLALEKTESTPVEFTVAVAPQESESETLDQSPGGDEPGGAGGMAADGSGGDMANPFGGGLAAGENGTTGIAAAGGGSRAGNGRSGAVTEFSRAKARKVEREMHTFIQNEQVPALDFGEAVSLRDILDVIERDAKGGQLRFVLDESDPTIGEDADYLNNTTVSNVALSSMSIASALDHLFAKVKDEELTWIVENEMVLITTLESAETDDRAIIRSYDVTTIREMFEVMAADAPLVGVGGGGGGFGGGGGGFGGGGGGFGGGGGYFMIPQVGGGLQSAGIGGTGEAGTGLNESRGMLPNTWQLCLKQEIQRLTSPPCTWMDAGGSIGTMSVVGNRLIVQQSRRGHEKVVEVLEELELAVEDETTY